MSVEAVEIIDLRSGKPGKFIEARLHDELRSEELIAAEREWRLVRFQVIFEMVKRGVPQDQMPQHWHWDWSRKASSLTLLANRAFGLECEGKWQGLMITTTVGHEATMPPDVAKPLVYVKFIESAPWNVRAFTAAPQFGGIGTRLIEAAVRQSMDEGFHGRIGLHSLPNPQTEGFYQRMGLARLGVDAAVESLPYYELSRTAASKLLAGGV